MLNGKYFYNQVVRKSVAVFGTIFNNIKIVRKNSTEEKVPIAYGPRKKFLARIQADTEAAGDRTIAIKMPRMSFEITSIDFDAASKLSKFNKRNIAISSSTTKVNTLYQSVPYTIGMQLNIFATNQDDALQIFEQILPTFTPEYTIAIKNLEGSGTVTDVPIILNSTSFSDDYEGDFETRRTLTYTLDFTMKVRFAGGTTEQDIIRTVDTFFYTDTDQPTAKINGAGSNTFTFNIDNLNGLPKVGMRVFGTGISGSPKVTAASATSITLSEVQTLADNTALTFKFVSADGEENVRVAVGDTDEPPLDETDTITTTFGFDHPEIASATLVLKHTGSGSAQITIGGVTLAYDGTSGTTFPTTVTAIAVGSARFQTVGSDIKFTGAPTITGGTIGSETFFELDTVTTNITWNGTSSQIVITTNGFRD